MFHNEWLYIIIYFLLYSICLGEGFANHMKHMATHIALNNNSDVLDQVVIQDVQSAMEQGIEHLAFYEQGNSDFILFTLLIMLLCGQSCIYSIHF